MGLPNSHAHEMCILRCKVDILANSCSTYCLLVHVKLNMGIQYEQIHMSPSNCRDLPQTDLFSFVINDNDNDNDNESG
jgi:hypothetical protein